MNITLLFRHKWSGGKVFERQTFVLIFIIQQRSLWSAHKVVGGCVEVRHSVQYTGYTKY